MYIFKNAFVSIFRNKSRNVLMAIIIMVIASASSITLAIMNSANKLVEAYKDKYNVEATISFDRKSLMENFTPGEDSNEDNIEKFNSIESLTIDEINNYGNSDYVNYFYYTYEIGINGNNIDPATQELEKVTTETTSTARKPMNNSNATTTKKTEKIFNKKGVNGDFTLIGYSSYEGMNNFINGAYSIKNGYISDNFNSYNCVINDELATLNEISVGDIITLESVNNDDLTYKLTVTGIFTDNSEESDNMTQMFSNSTNIIITNTKVIEDIANDDDDLNITTNPTFILKSENVVEYFSDEVSKKGLNENLKVSTNIDTIASETEPIKNVSTFALTFLIITLIVGTVVLLLINMINVRERKYEIGVLRTIGMKKSSVTLQFVCELLLVSIIGLFLGAIIGSTSSVRIANKLLETEITNTTETTKKISDNFGNKGDFNFKMNGVTKIKQVDNINAVVNFKVLIELLGIGIVFTILSGSVAMISISKFSPLTILKERS